ncbi:hypothetical protein [Staphylococcus epidermidis]|uniref:hypothetical protein n=1 Tax=Staphylococcus epidermidis TaxID=1282 RepID=UPI001642E60E|nr:hypothetical protein [Staphylococcus epidermidis]
MRCVGSANGEDDKGFNEWIEVGNQIDGDLVIGRDGDGEGLGIVEGDGEGKM